MRHRLQRHSGQNSWIIGLFAGLALGAPRAEAQYVRSVPYFNQTRNQIEPSGSCQNSIAAMLLKYYGAAAITPDAISQRWGTSKAQTVKGWELVFNTEAAERGLAFRDTGIDNGRLSAVHRILDQGRPVGVHGGFTDSGHLIVLLGYDDEYYYVHDPNGDWSKNYSGNDLEAGRHARYPRPEVERAIRALSTGYVRYHAFDPDPGYPALVWEQSPPDSVLSGAALDLELSVRLEAGQPLRLKADLSQLGGAREIDLAPAGEGRYQLGANLDLGAVEPGWKQVIISAAEEIEGELRRFRLVHSIAVLAPRERPIFADGWAPGWAPGLLVRADLDPASPDQVYAGASALAVAADFYNMEVVAAEPIGTVGYGALRFAFHPGTVTGDEHSTFSLYVNNDNRTLVKLLDAAAGAPLVDLERRQWQVVEIPLQHFTWPENPIKTFHFFGNVRGTFYLDDMHLVAARPCPLAASWTHAAAAAAAGTAFDLELSVRLERGDASGQEPRLSADLSELGGPPDVPLRPAGASTYHLRSALQLPPDSGQRQLRVRIEQTVGEKTWNLHLSRALLLLPTADLPLFADGFSSSWQLDYAHSAALDLAAREQVFEGSSSLAVDADNFTVEWSTPAPVEAAGYGALRLAFHPGAVVAGPRAAFNLIVNGDPRTAVRLLPREDEAGYLAVDQGRWQVAEVPLSAFGDFDGPLRSLRLLGNLQGTFYLDDVRLVATPPATLPTAVAPWQEPAAAVFTLSQNAPNPFNSSTAIRFSLAAAAPVHIAIYNLSGQQVRLLTAAPMPAGVHTLHWDGRDRHGRNLASGAYLYQLHSGAQSQSRKMVLLR